ncbi:MAG TPA: alpha/beta fold hydrolase [Myxococcota bacterium]|nr:alpha/beta fold hydrolase [Myxococcota bacterium]
MIPAWSDVGDPGAPRVAWILHGILGSGRNWRAFSRRLAERLPDWRFVSIDLRNHGDSHPADPPHTVAACARDLGELAARIGAPAAVIGHSFGGKVAMAYGRDVDAAARIVAVDAVPFAVDPGALDDEVLAVLAMIERLPMPARDHAEVQRAFVEAGFSEMIAGWMTTNLRRAPDGLRWRLNVPAMREMLVSYAAEDLGPWLAGPGGPVCLVRAGRSQRWTAEALARLASLPRAQVELVAESGHWVHVEAPDALLGIIERCLQAR